MRRSLTGPAIAAAGGLIAAAVWWRTHPSPCPYGQRFWVQAPHPIITRKRLLRVLAPAPGEHVLELGSGTGYYTLPVAHALEGGRLTMADIQPEMLEHTERRAQAAGIHNLEAVKADAQELPFAEDTFDAAFAVTMLGEVPDPDRALAELARVIKPRGRLVIGELFGDPHMVTFNALTERAERSGLRVQSRSGGPLGYFALLHPAGSDASPAADAALASARS